MMTQEFETIVPVFLGDSADGDNRKSVFLLHEEEEYREGEDHDDDEEEEGEYHDPLADDGMEEEHHEVEDEEVNSDCESEDSIIELEVEKCPMCGDTVPSAAELSAHLASAHFRPGLLAELRARGWEDGGRECPECGVSVSEDSLKMRIKMRMVEHWAGRHGRAEAMVARCLGGGEVRLGRDRNQCNTFIQKHAKFDVRMDNKPAVKEEINKLLHGPDEDSSEEEEDNIITLDDSSDDEIEIIETIPVDTKKKHNDVSVEPILEKIPEKEHPSLQHLTPTPLQHVGGQTHCLNIPHLQQLSAPAREVDVKTRLCPEPNDFPEPIVILDDINQKTGDDPMLAVSDPESPPSRPVEPLSEFVAEVATQPSVYTPAPSLQEISCADISQVLAEAPLTPLQHVGGGRAHGLNTPHLQQLSAPARDGGHMTREMFSDGPLSTNGFTSKNGERSSGNEKKNIISMLSAQQQNHVTSNSTEVILNNGHETADIVMVDEERTPSQHPGHASQPDARAREEEMLRRVQPRVSQCLECLADLGSAAALARHMVTSQHLNISWAAQTNIRSGNGGYRWYLKPSKYSCLICSEQNNAGMLFNSIKSVLLHIVKSHQQRFLAEYADTLTEDSFLLCKICKSFISFHNITSERARRRKELGHYFLNHGQVFLYSLGVLSVPAASVYSCNLCHEAAPSYKLFTDHLQSHHAQD